jgi:hypothetical protein
VNLRQREIQPRRLVVRRYVGRRLHRRVIAPAPVRADERRVEALRARS